MGLLFPVRYMRICITRSICAEYFEILLLRIWLVAVATFQWMIVIWFALINCFELLARTPVGWFENVRRYQFEVDLLSTPISTLSIVSLILMDRADVWVRWSSLVMSVEHRIDASAFDFATYTFLIARTTFFYLQRWENFPMNPAID